MTLAHLIKTVNMYLQTDFPATTRHTLFQQGDTAEVQAAVDDLIITAANNARRWAEMRHDFMCASVTLPATIPSEGMVDLNNIDGISVKNIEAIDYADTKTPISVINKKSDWYRRYEQLDRLPDGARQTDGTRYSDFGYNLTYLESKILLQGNKLSTASPCADALDITIHGFEWLPNYSLDVFTGFHQAVAINPGGNLLLNNDDSWPDNTTEVEFTVPVFNGSEIVIQPGRYPVVNQASRTLILSHPAFTDPNFQPNIVVKTYSSSGPAPDWFLTHGFEYMQWATIVEVNHLLQTFVQRQEGSLSPPEQLRERAFEAMRQLDVYASEGGVYHELR